MSKRCSSPGEPKRCPHKRCPSPGDPLKGSKGAGVHEVVEEDDGRAYRCICTARFFNAVYVLHAFEKKSKKGISTPKQHIDRVRERLKEAETDHASRPHPT